MESYLALFGIVCIIGISVSSNWLHLQINVCYSHIIWFECADKSCLYLFVKSLKYVYCSILVWVVLFYKCLQSKICSLSFQNVVTFFIQWFIDSFIIWTVAKYFQKWKWGKSEYDPVMLYINLTPFFKLSSKVLFVWSCDLSLTWGEKASTACGKYSSFYLS